ncbi:branched-chain amino acid transport system II carrier protein [Lactococcus lactis]|uniref:branched-chain amino acid transport system II carrier protein n=1 Tax=Lactococcus lactis TaxID=1358 RepID=UPI00050D0A6C|nr:branched-chain amino acid transport system II carrier protein [Lactococcus lactis]AIS03227.1 Branched-chain amino acid transport system carrier protein [Lactococcus lactis]
MEEKLAGKDYLFIGSMLFGLFFGAGNLIFPIHMGQEAGSAISQANFGFLITAVGFPFLGIIALGISQSNGVFELASRVNRIYAYIFTILLYLVIGPFFALPRLATTSFEIGISPFLSHELQAPLLALFSILFFGTAWFLSRKPTKLLDYIGKFLNPLFLVLLGIILVIAFTHPLGKVSQAEIGKAYQASPILTGFTQGYNTLDALAALAFGIIIITTIRQRGVKNPKIIAKETIKAGLISVGLMAIIYTCLSYLGTMSLGQFAISENGGIALAQISNHYLGNFGMIILALIVIIACLKTAVGLMSAFSETFAELFPKKEYRFYLLIVSILPCIFANIGLTKIIELSVPVLMFLYPLAIILILLALLSPLFKHSRLVYQITTAFTLLAAIIDGLNALPASLHTITFISVIINFAKDFLPFFSLGMGWILPAVLGFIIGCLCQIAITVYKNKKSSTLS